MRETERKRGRKNTKESHKGGKQVNIEQSAVKVFFRFVGQHVRQGVANDERVYVCFSEFVDVSCFKVMGKLTKP